MGLEVSGGVFPSCNGHNGICLLKKLSPAGDMFWVGHFDAVASYEWFSVVCTVGSATHVGEACAVFPAS